MKVIIDIPKDMFEWFKNGEIIDEYDKSALKQVFKNGIPLDDVKFHIEHLACKQYDHKLMLDREEVLEIIDKHISGKENE